jgi:hypothetical protein
VSSRTPWTRHLVNLLDTQPAVPVLAAAEHVTERPLTRSEYEAVRRAAWRLHHRWLAGSDGRRYLLTADKYRGVNIDGREQPTLYLVRVPAELLDDPDRIGPYVSDLGLELPRPPVRAIAALLGVPRSTVARDLATARNVASGPPGTDATREEVPR